MSIASVGGGHHLNSVGKNPLLNLQRFAFLALIKAKL